MNRLKSVLAAAALTFTLGISAAGEAPLCQRGETQTPPCPSALETPENPAQVMPGETQTPPKAQEFEIVSLVELALHAVLLA